MSGLHEPLRLKGSKTRWGKVYVRKKNRMVEVAWLWDKAVRSKRRIFWWMEILFVFGFAVS